MIPWYEYKVAISCLNGEHQVLESVAEAGGVRLSVVRICFHGAVCHRQTRNKFVIRSKNGKAIIQSGEHKILLPE